MLSLTFTNQKAFTKLLFLADTFDRFEVSEALFRTFSTFQIDGSLLRDYYGTAAFSGPEPKPDMSAGPNVPPAHALWKQVRPIAFSIMKGNRLPLSFHISFCAPPPMLAEVAQACGTSDSDTALIEALFLNINYKDGIMQCTSATSQKVFSLDKTLEHTWDKYIIAFLDYHEISYQSDI